MKCKFCGFEWSPRKKDVKSCPNCKRYFAKLKKINQRAKCLKCGYVWNIRKKIGEIKLCPSCKIRFNEKWKINQENVKI